MELIPDGSSNYGTVQLCVNDEFREVCGDSWGIKETRVVCTEFGYATNSTGTAAKAQLECGYYTNISLQGHRDL